MRRCYTLTISTGVHPYFLGSFYVVRRDGGLVERGSELFWRLRRELYNTQILATESPMYQDFVVKQVLTGEEAPLIDAFIGFCHTNLAHNQPHRRHREAGGGESDLHRDLQRHQRGDQRARSEGLRGPHVRLIVARSPGKARGAAG